MMVLDIIKIGNLYNIVLNGGLEIFAKIVDKKTGGDLVINGCKKLSTGSFHHYPPFSKLNSNILLKSNSIIMICEVDEDIRLVYEQYIEKY